MKLEDQVCSLELAKRLKQLGVKQDSYFYWAQPAIGLVANRIPKHVQPKSAQWANWPSAFTVAELGEILPCHVPSMKDVQGYSCSTLVSEDGEETHWDSLENFDAQTTWGSNEADARAKMLIYLIENKLVKP